MVIRCRWRNRNRGRNRFFYLFVYFIVSLSVRFGSIRFSSVLVHFVSFRPFPFRFSSFLFRFGSFRFVSVRSVSCRFAFFNAHLIIMHSSFYSFTDGPMRALSCDDNFWVVKITRFATSATAPIYQIPGTHKLGISIGPFLQYAILGGNGRTLWVRSSISVSHPKHDMDSKEVFRATCP